MMDTVKKCSDIFHFSPKKQLLLKITHSRTDALREKAKVTGRLSHKVDNET